MGVRRGRVGLVVSHLPNRKKPVLIATNENCAKVIASFKSEEDSEIFNEALDYICKPLIGGGEEGRKP